MAFEDFITKLIGGGAGTLMTGVSDIIGKFKVDPTEKANMDKELQEFLTKHQEVMAQQALDQYKAELADMENARNREIQLNESANAGWLSKNVISIIALFVSIIWGGLTVYLLLRMLDFIAANPNVKMDVILGLYAGLSATMGILMNYYFGTSHSAVEKDKTIATIAKQS